MTDNITYSFVACDVSVTLDEKNIERELIERYHGVKQVTRLFFNDKKGSPKTRVQIDFQTYKDAKKIYRDRSIIIGGICRRVYTIQTPPYQEYHQQRQNTWQQEPETEPEPEPEFLTEQDLIDIFEQQKTSLQEVMNSFEKKLNYAINLHGNHNMTEWPALSKTASQCNAPE